MIEHELYQMIQAEAERDGEELTGAEINARVERILHIDPKTQRKAYELYEKLADVVRKKRIVIVCDEATRDRIIEVFDESWSCFFGHGMCGAFKTKDGPDCINCIKQRAEWIISETPNK